MKPLVEVLWWGFWGFMLLGPSLGDVSNFIREIRSDTPDKIILHKSTEPEVEKKPSTTKATIESL